MMKREKEWEESGSDDTYRDDREGCEQRGPYASAQREYHEPLDNGAHPRESNDDVKS